MAHRDINGAWVGDGMVYGLGGDTITLKRIGSTIAVDNIPALMPQAGTIARGKIVYTVVQAAPRIGSQRSSE
jgi:hypothetical protein